MSKRIFTLYKSIDQYLILALAFFLLIMSSFLTTFPYLDGNIDFVKTYDFHLGGFHQYFSNWQSVHPPLKLLIASLFYKIGGFNIISFNAIGLFFGLIGIIYFYLLSNVLFNRNIARISTFLLATCPFYISVGIFSLIDFLLTVFVLISSYFYVKRNYVAYAISSSLIVLVKETGLIFILAVLLIEGIFFFKNGFQNIRKSIFSFMFTLVPFGIITLWFFFLKLNNKTEWREWIFTKTADRGAIYTILHNLTTFQFLNTYTLNHWLNLFILNFNWVYWFLASIFFIALIRNKIERKKVFDNIFREEQKGKTVFAIIFFFITYFFTVLTLQTYTIPRYILPLFPFLILISAASIYSLNVGNKFLYTTVLVIVSSITILRLFTSLDPVSIAVWGRTEIFGQTVYSPYGRPVGVDGITYNMQYLFIAKKRTKQILAANNEAAKVLGEKTRIHNSSTVQSVTQKQSVISEDCHWIFPDPNNDSKTMKILKLKYAFDSCVNK